MNATASVKPATSRPALEAAPTRILIAGGTARRRSAIRRSLERIRATLVDAAWDDYQDHLEPGFAAMVIAEPLVVSLAGAVAAVRGHPAGRHLAIYGLTDGAASAPKARNAYLAGANAVIEWPRERAILAGILAETLGMVVVRGPSTRPDLSLTRTVRAHLRLGPRPGAAIRLSSEKGVVTAAGEARTLAQLSEIVETIAAVPGVKRVVTRDLRVAPTGIPDATVRKSLRAVIRATSELEPGALAVTVDRGRVKLRGKVSSRARFHDLLDRVAAVKGVRELDWKINLPGPAAASDAAATRRLRRAIATLFPAEKVEVSVLAGVAVLSGRVRSLAAGRAIGRLAARQDEVARVVDKLVVEPRRR